MPANIEGRAVLIIRNRNKNTTIQRMQSDFRSFINNAVLQYNLNIEVMIEPEFDIIQEEENVQNQS